MALKRPPASAALAGAAVLIVYLLRLNRGAGLMVDDGWYMLLAKALAEGAGYRLISSATTAILPMYPPGFPAVLAPVFMIAPDFPENVWLLKSVSIAAMMGVGVLSYLYLSRERRMARDLAALASLAIVLTPALVFLATSTVMSEGVFTLAQLATVLLVHRSAASQRPRDQNVSIVLAAAMASATLLVRSAGICVIAASGAWLLKERRWTRALVFGAVVAACAGPWVVYTRAHLPTAEERAAHGGWIAYSYGEQFWMKWAGAPSTGYVTVRDLPGRVATNVVDVFGRGVAGIIIPSIFRGPQESGEEVVALGGTVAGIMPASMGIAPAALAISFLLSGVLLLGFVRTAREEITVAEILVPLSLALTVLWPFWTFRFLLPLTPFLLLYFVRGVLSLGRARAARIALLCLIGLHVYDHAGYLYLTRPGTQPSSDDWLARAADVESTLNWMGTHLKPGSVVATTNPGLVYLRTGLKSVTFEQVPGDWGQWKRRGVRYVACLRPESLPRHMRSSYRVLYETTGRRWVIEL